MSHRPKDFYEFGPYRIDPDERRLLRDQGVIPLPPKAFETLLILVRNSEQVVLKDDLMKTLWPDTFVEEANLTQNVFVLRKALGESAQAPHYIVTVPGPGYRFTEKVATAEPGELVVQSRSVQTVTIKEETQPSWYRLVWLGVAGFVLVAGTLLLYRTYISPRTPPTPTAVLPALPPRRSIAVLGFRNLSGRSEEAWLSTALSEMLSTELVAGEKLRLVPGEEISRAKHDISLTDADSLSRETLGRLHKGLGTDLVVLGSYTALGEKPNDRIRLDIRMQDTLAGETVADVAVVGTEEDLFDLVSQAGSRLRENLGVEAVSPVEAVSVRASLPANREAARLYSEGLARLRVFDAPEARDLLQRAVKSDPKYPLAHAALADAWSKLGYETKAQAEAKQAYDLCANLSREERLVVEGRYREANHQSDAAIDVYRALFTLFPDNLDYGLRLAGAQTRGSKGHDALATVATLRKLAPPLSEDPRIELQEARAWNALGDFKHQVEPLSRAAEKAKVQGARLILANARREQCFLFTSLTQTENAISACRESRDLYAAAGDRVGEADTLRTWADAINQADVRQAIRLYQQSQAMFRDVGFEDGVIVVYNNLGVLYEQMGNIVEAEKMHRQAKAGFQLLDDKGREAAATANLANERQEQGDLPGAVKLYEEALQLDRETENPGNAAIAGYNLASLRHLQGDLPTARQEFEESLATWQKTGDQYSALYAMSALASLFRDQGDFAGARKILEQVLAMYTPNGDKVAVAETQLALAELSLEEKRDPADQEAMLRSAIEVFHKEAARDDEAQAGMVLARALLVQNKNDAARDAAQRAAALGEKSQNREIRWQIAIAKTRLESMIGPRNALLKSLDSMITMSHQMGYFGTELDARLAQGEIEKKMGSPAARSHLERVAADAKTKGYISIATKASAAFAEH